MKRIYRQGDVLISQVRAVPSKLELVPEDQGRIVLAYGEVTGHAHAIDCSLDQHAFLSRELETERRFLTVDEPVELRHEEHSTIRLLKGRYEITIQREYDPTMIRQVID